MRIVCISSTPLISYSVFRNVHIPKEEASAEATFRWVLEREQSHQGSRLLTEQVDKMLQTFILDTVSSSAVFNWT
ncbi:hypothetical protein AV530_005824 [Patagioenas fasciata monilis]|uniref:Uncharacterized protein n=1 Tax=Patagioenas fasciata monilis TaxID=372326 RepID=A0A1V4JMS9_PATFA|nr:hypothetical protein AV530_005824 [Patagioenas fasciata monilis]